MEDVGLDGRVKYAGLKSVYWIHVAGFVGTVLNLLFLHDVGYVLISRGCDSF